MLHDEVWNHFEGAPLRLIRYDETELSETLIGPGCDDYTYVFEGGLWQAAESTGDYSLVGCSVAPGFDFADFSFMNEVQAAQISEKFAAYARFI